MALMTAKEYIDSLRKLNTRVYMFGEKLDNWVDHPMIRPSINCVAMTYALAQDPRYEELMTATSSLTGRRINRFTHLHQSADDLVKKVKMQRLLGQKTASCFQRCVGMDGSTPCTPPPTRSTRSSAQAITRTSRNSLSTCRTTI